MGLLDDENAGQAPAPQPTFAPAPDNSNPTPYSVSTTPTGLTPVGNEAAPVETPAPVTPTVADSGTPIKQRTIAGYINQRPGKVMFTSASGVAVRSNIIDRTSTGGMTPKAISILQTVAENAAGAGIMQIDVTAAKGGGHRSHGGGTEWDVKGYTADGKLWSPEQRAAVAAAGASAGADRFGLYSFGKGFLGNGSLHIGYSGPGRPSAVWGFRGKIGGDSARAFVNPAEVRFLSMFNAGKLGAGYKSLAGSALAIAQPEGSTPAEAAAAAQATGAPIPPARPDTASPAFGAKGARQAEEPFSLDALGAVVIDQGRIIGKGERGDHIAEVQAFLNLQGIRDKYGNPLSTDGVMGRRTKQAVKTYQREARLTVDGLIGPETYQAMLFDLSPGTAVMPGKAAYDRGNRTAAKIVDPVAPDAAVPLPRRRPVIEVDVTKPRLRPTTRALQDLGYIKDALDADRAALAAGPAGRALDMADKRALWAKRAADMAMRQRFDDAHAAGPTFTPGGNAFDLDAMAIRTGEAVREFTRGIADRYRQVIEAKRVTRALLTMKEGRTKDDAVQPDILSDGGDTPSGLATLTYGFGPDASGQTREQWLAERAKRLGR